MTRTQIKILANEITNQELLQMFQNAKNGIKDWTKVSSCNKSFTKGAAWNILTRDFDLDSNIHILGKMNMIREFKEFLPAHLKPIKKVKQKNKLHHQEPIFSNIK